MSLIARLIAWLNEDDPARVRNSGAATATGPGSVAITGVNRSSIRTTGKRHNIIAGNLRITGTDEGQTVESHGRRIVIRPDGGVMVDGVDIDARHGWAVSHTTIPRVWTTECHPDHVDRFAATDGPHVTLNREVANQIENLLIAVEGTNKHTGTRINWLRRTLSQAITDTDRKTRPHP